jgi:hypothetical protein
MTLGSVHPTAEMIAKNSSGVEGSRSECKAEYLTAICVPIV